MSGQRIMASGKTSVGNIIIGERRREELGDIDGLMRSIETHGLLHPIVLALNEEQRYVLVAGFRRLEAVKRLGWERVSYTLFDQLSERELREIELEENIRRKDFTQYEQSKNMVELVKLVKEKLREEAESFPILEEDRQESDSRPSVSEDEFRSDLTEIHHKTELRPNLVINQRGRPATPDSDRIAAEYIGKPLSSVQNAHAHVAAVDKYPPLEALPKMKAIETAKELDKLPDKEEREQRISEAMRQINEKHAAERDVAKKIRKLITASFGHPIPEQEIDVYLDWYKHDIDSHIRDIDVTIAALNALKGQLLSRKTLRRVK